MAYTYSINFPLFQHHRCIHSIYLYSILYINPYVLYFHYTQSPKVVYYDNYSLKIEYRFLVLAQFPYFAQVHHDILFQIFSYLFPVPFHYKMGYSLIQMYLLVPVHQFQPDDDTNYSFLFSLLDKNFDLLFYLDLL